MSARTARLNSSSGAQASSTVCRMRTSPQTMRHGLMPSSSSRPASSVTTSASAVEAASPMSSMPSCVNWRGSPTLTWSRTTGAA